MASVAEQVPELKRPDQKFLSNKPRIGSMPVQGLLMQNLFAQARDIQQQVSQGSGFVVAITMDDQGLPLPDIGGH